MKKIILTFIVAGLFTACNTSSDSESEEIIADVVEATAYSFDLAKTDLTWTAFKTPEKLGVPGSFDEITLTGNSFTINTKSVNTGNEPRDEKLVSFFFDNLSDSLITGSYGAISEGVMPITLNMNGVEKIIEFAVSETDSSTVISGSIDIVSDFSGNAALEAISEACKVLHLDKTWSDVNLTVVQTK